MSLSWLPRKLVLANVWSLWLPWLSPRCLSGGPWSGPWSLQDETLQFGLEAFMLNNDVEESEVSCAAGPAGGLGTLFLLLDFPP